MVRRAMRRRVAWSNRENQMYRIRYWSSAHSSVYVERSSLPYALAWSLATKAGWYKCQVINEQWGSICFETRNDFLQ
jgi:hypothetical protein